MACERHSNRRTARALNLHHRHGLLAAGFAADAVLLDHDWRVTEVWAETGALYINVSGLGYGPEATLALDVSGKSRAEAMAEE